MRSACAQGWPCLQGSLDAWFPAPPPPPVAPSCAMRARAGEAFTCTPQGSRGPHHAADVVLDAGGGEQHLAQLAPVALLVGAADAGQLRGGHGVVGGRRWGGWHGTQQRAAGAAHGPNPAAAKGQGAELRVGARPPPPPPIQQSAATGSGAHPLADGAGGLIGRQDALAGGGDGLGGSDQLRGMLRHGRGEGWGP